MPDYSTLITAAGQTAFANAIATAEPVNITTMAVGDSNGVGYDPSENQTALVHQVYTSNAIDVTVEAGGIIAVEMTIPADQGGWHIREAAVKDDAGTVLAIMRYPDSYKPLPSSSIASVKTITMKLDVGNTNAVSWSIAPAAKEHIARQLRPDFRSVEAVLNAPPGGADPGETWIVGLAPTGAWAGHANDLAEWTGTAWAFAAPTPRMLVGRADGVDLRWEHTASPPAWTEWKASTTKRGPVRLATPAEAADPANPDNPLTPATLREALGLQTRVLSKRSTSGTYVAPLANPRFAGAMVTLIAGGGGGGLSHSPDATIISGGGGGNGQFMQRWFPRAELTATQTVTIGGGGAGRTTAEGPGPGGVGGDGAFGFLFARGGSPGTGFGGLHGSGGVGGGTGAGTSAGIYDASTLMIKGSQGENGFLRAGGTVPTPLGDVGRGGQGGYTTTGGVNSSGANGANGFCLIEEWYV